MGHGEIDGVRVVWNDEIDEPDEYAGTLVFGVGARDEGVDELGLTQFALALVLDAVSTEADQTFGIADTAITATGTPEDVAAHFAECCAVIRDVPVNRIADSERMDAVAQEIHQSDRIDDMLLDDDMCRDPWGSLLSRRSGPSLPRVSRAGSSGPGAIRWPAVDAVMFAPEDVRAHLARYFTAGNAVLVLSGPPPEGLRLPLPAGDPVVREAPSPPLSASGWYTDDVFAPGIVFRSPNSRVALQLLHLLAGRVDEKLNHYSCGTRYVPIDAATAEVGVCLTPEVGVAEKDADRQRRPRCSGRSCAASPPTTSRPTTSSRSTT